MLGRAARVRALLRFTAFNPGLIESDASPQSPQAPERLTLPLYRESSIMTVQDQLEALEKQLSAMLKFPDQNPNPVLKLGMDGRLVYSNSAGDPILRAWAVQLGDAMPESLVAHAQTAADASLELAVGNRTFSFHVVAVPEIDAINVYGTDVTAMKAITKFPDQNPNPVLKTSMAGQLLYANTAGMEIREVWGIELGDAVPRAIRDASLLAHGEALELEVGERTFSFYVVPVPEFDFINIYGTDISAAKDNERILMKLAKYFSPQVYESIFTGDLEVKIQTQRKRLSVFFSDIKGFSEITERLEPEVLTELITDYLTAMTDIAVKHGGTVDKYIGDAIMVFFGDPKSRGHKEDAIACVEMALEMKSALREIRKTWKARGIAQPLDIRIGIHTDTCTVGNFGSHDRLDYTTIGNGVNLASRLESNSRPNQILISEDTYLLIRDVISCDKKDKIQVKNIKHPIQTYEVCGRLDEVSGGRQIEETAEGFSLFIDPSKIEGVQDKRDLLERALAILDRIED
jgi:class 3 adenylate cyclase